MVFMENVITRALLTGEVVPGEAWSQLVLSEIKQGIARALVVARQRRSIGDSRVPAANEIEQRGRILLYLKGVHDIFERAREDFSRCVKSA